MVLRFRHRSQAILTIIFNQYVPERRLGNWDYDIPLTDKYDIDRDDEEIMLLVPMFMKVIIDDANP